MRNPLPPTRGEGGLSHWKVFLCAGSVTKQPLCDGGRLESPPCRGVAPVSGDGETSVCPWFAGLCTIRKLARVK